MEFETEKHPLPEPVRYRFEDWEVGATRFCETLAKAESMQNASLHYRRIHDCEFKLTRRKVEGGYRLWRVQ